MSLFYNSINNKVKNIGGAILSGGHNTNGAQNYLQMVNLNNNNNTIGRPYAPIPVLGVHSTKALGVSESVFAFNNKNPVAKIATTTINNSYTNHELSTSGTVNTGLIVGIHPITSNINRLDTTAIRNNQFDSYTGKFNDGYPEISNDDFGNDMAATPNRANPGLMNFTLGKNIISKQYPTKTN